ncbi:MAG: gliding motility-associated C-terminal domain-containing protein [Saprospiraceae bacterium]
MNTGIWYKIVLLSFFLVAAFQAKATHNRAGEIVVEMVPNADGACGLTVKATIVTYTKTSSENADRDTLTICWDRGGPCEQVPRANGVGMPPQGVPLENDIKYNIYVAYHTYDGPGTYTIHMEDPNRNAGVLNVNFPNSVSIPFYIETVFTIVNPVFSGCNNSPVLRVPPIDFACLGEVFTHNPGAFDIDRDSLVYDLAVCQQGPDDPVPNFFFPDGMSINRLTGDLVWDAPNQVGEFNIAIIIISFRNGVPLDTMVRDMQIIVEDCSNEPPVVLTEVEELCVIAGTTIDFQVVATAPITDTDQRVRLIAYGAPFTLENSPAVMIPPSEAYFDDPLSKRFRWETTCDHISSQPYNVVFRAVDDFLGDTTGLATLKTVRILVVGPPPEDVQAEAEVDNVVVSWALPYTCEDTEEDYFRGFSVWRRLNSDQTPLDTCDPGLEGRGYTKISPDTLMRQVNGRYFFVDENIERGRTYCYRILANFALRTANGLFFYNPVASLPSEEACVQLGRELPLLLKVDVEATDVAGGQIGVCWSKPNAADLDTILNGGPYVYELLRSIGHNENTADFVPIHSVSSPFFSTANDTCFTDIGLNTVGDPYTYAVNFYVNGEPTPLGVSTPAGSVFLQSAPSDRIIDLVWDELVPWENFSYTVFRENLVSGVFELLGTTMSTTYRDSGLVNGQEYCYYLQAEGTYNIDGLPEPLVNRSQIVCATPTDNVAPCPPALAVSNLCNTDIDCENIEQLDNQLTWDDPRNRCPEAGDVAGYRVYYAPDADTPPTLIAAIADEDVFEFTHSPDFGLAGCYRVTAVDTVGNESTFSNVVCVDNCPVYELPNAFTPNADGQNDLYVPIKSCFIAAVEFQVFNRWGGLVFETTNPVLNWNGTNTNNEPLAEGTYFYKCQVFEQRVDGIVPADEFLSGFIELIRGAGN